MCFCEAEAVAKFVFVETWRSLSYRKQHVLDAMVDGKWRNTVNTASTLLMTRRPCVDIPSLLVGTWAPLPAGMWTGHASRFSTGFSYGTPINSSSKFERFDRIGLVVKHISNKYSKLLGDKYRCSAASEASVAKMVNTAKRNLEVIFWGDSLVAQLWTAAQLLRPVPQVTFSYIKDDFLRAENVTARVHNCNGTGGEQCTVTPADQYLALFDHFEAVDILIMNTGAHYAYTQVANGDTNPKNSPQKRQAVTREVTRVFLETLAIVARVVQLLQLKYPGIHVFWHELPIMKTHGKPGWGWEYFTEKNLKARAVFSEAGMVFINSTMPGPNTDSTWTRHDGLHFCNPGPVPLHVLQMALHIAAFVGRADVARNRTHNTPGGGHVDR